MARKIRISHMPKEENEIILVLNENNEISDVTLYALGLVDKQTMLNATPTDIAGEGNIPR